MEAKRSMWSEIFKLSLSNKQNKGHLETICTRFSRKSHILEHTLVRTQLQIIHDVLSQVKLKSLHHEYTNYKRPLDSYACPVQSKGNRTNQSTFLRGKNILKWCNYTGKSKMYSYSFSFLAQKALFLHPLETLNTTHIDPRYTLFSDQSVQLSDEVPSVKFEWWV